MSALRIVTSKSTRMRSLVESGCRWEDNIRIYLKEIGVNTRH